MRMVRLEDARNVYVARTYAYVAGGKQGLAIVNVEQPEQPRLDQIFSDGGKINDLRDVKIGMVDASVFAFLADGRNGLRVLQMSFARGFAECLRLQPAANSQADRQLPHRRAGSRDLQGSGPRPRRGRKRKPARGVWTPRRTAAQSRGSRPLVSPRRQSLPHYKRSAGPRALSGYPPVAPTPSVLKRFDIFILFVLKRMSR